MLTSRIGAHASSVGMPPRWMTAAAPAQAAVIAAMSVTDAVTDSSPGPGDGASGVTSSSRSTRPGLASRARSMVPTWPAAPVMRIVGTRHEPTPAGLAGAGRGHRRPVPGGVDAPGGFGGVYNRIMITTDELRRTLGPLGIWMPPPARIGIEPESYAREIEAAGFTSVWYPGMNSPADLAAVEPALAATERLVLGTGIASVWTWAPAELAAAAERLENLYPGRFILGLGVSHAPAVEAAGQAYVKPYAKMVRFLGEMPATAAPVILAALGPKMLELSRDRAAGAHPYFSPPEHTAIARQVLGPAPLLVPEIAVSLTPGDSGAAQARDYAKMYLRLPNYTGNLRRLGYTDADIDGGGSDRLMSDVVPHGPEASLARITGHLDAGGDHVVVQLIGEGGRFAAGDLKALAELTTGLR